MPLSIITSDFPEDVQIGQLLEAVVRAARANWEGSVDVQVRDGQLSLSFRGSGDQGEVLAEEDSFAIGEGTNGGLRLLTIATYDPVGAQMVGSMVHHHVHVGLGGDDDTWMVGDTSTLRQPVIAFTGTWPNLQIA